MVTLRRIGVQSAGRFGFFIGMTTSIANFTFFFFMLFVVHGVPISVLPPDIWREIGLSIFFSSTVMSFAVGMFAFLYNMSPSIGGLQLEFDMPDSPRSKRKNDDSDDDNSVEIV